MVCDRMDIDVWSVIEAAATKPFGFMKFTPGPGIGGHCIPVDPFYLTWKAREHGLTTRFIGPGQQINSGMPRYVIDRLRIALSEDGKPLRDAKVLVLGVAYKPGVEDMRESPALDVIELLIEGQADVRYHDPFVPELPQMRKHDLRLGGSRDLTESILRGGLVLITTDHEEVDYESVMTHASLVVDTRNAVRPRLGAGPFGARLVMAKATCSSRRLVVMSAIRQPMTKPPNPPAPPTATEDSPTVTALSAVGRCASVPYKA